MKKIIVILASLSLMMLVSCKKDRVCECTDSSTEPGTTTQTYSYTILESNKKNAAANCFSYSYDYTSNGSTYKETTTCKLK